MKYVAPYGAVDPDAPYINGNPATGTRGSIPPNAAFEHTMREIVEVIEYAGLTPDAEDLTQLRQAIVDLIGGGMSEAFSIHWAPTDTGTANVVTAVCTPAITAYASPMLVIFRKKVGTPNTGACTANFGPGNVYLKDNTASDFSSGALPGGSIQIVMFDGSGFRALGGSTSYTSVSSLTANSGEGIAVDGGTEEVSLDFTRTTHDATPAVADLWVRRKNADGHHVNMTHAEFIAMLSQEQPIGRVFYGAITAGPNDLVIPTLTPQPTSLFTGMVVITTIAAANTGNMRANVGGFGLKQIVRPSLGQIEPNCANPGSLLVMVYDGTKFQAQAGLLDNELTEIIDGADVQYLEANLSGWDYAEITMHNLARKQTAAGGYVLGATFQTENSFAGFGGSTVPIYPSFGVAALGGAGQARGLARPMSPLGPIRFVREYARQPDYQGNTLQSAAFNAGMVPQAGGMFPEQSDLYPPSGDLIHQVGITFPCLEYFVAVACKSSTGDYNSSYKFSSIRMIVRKVGRSSP